MIRDPGDTIVLEGMIGPRTGLAIPAVLVDTNGPNLICFVQDGTSILRLLPTGDAPLPRVLSLQQIVAMNLQLRSQTWMGKNILYIAPKDGRYAVHVRWSSNWTFQGW